MNYDIRNHWIFLVLCSLNLYRSLYKMNKYKSWKSLTIIIVIIIEITDSFRYSKRVNITHTTCSKTALSIWNISVVIHILIVHKLLYWVVSSILASTHIITHMMDSRFITAWIASLIINKFLILNRTFIFHMIILYYFALIFGCIGSIR